MTDAAQTPKPQEPRTGPRGRIRVIIPSTNIGVEHGCGVDACYGKGRLLEEF